MVWIEIHLCKYCELVCVSQPGLEAGDVIIVLQQKYHDKFQRSSDDLVMTHTITLTEALCGFSLVVKHLDGRDLLITHSRGQVIKPGKFKKTYSKRFYSNFIYITGILNSRIL